MELVLKILLGIVKTFCFFGLGALALRLKIFDKQESAHFSRFVIDVMTPFLTFYSVVRNFSRQDGAVFWQLPLLGFGIMLFGMLCGYGLQYGMKNKTPRRMATFVHLAAVNNYLFLPLILLDSLYGSKAVGYLFLLSVGSTVGFWTCGIFALAGAAGKPKAEPAEKTPVEEAPEPLAEEEEDQDDEADDDDDDVPREPFKFRLTKNFDIFDDDND